MIYINDNKLIRSYINNYNKSYINGKVMYWNYYVPVNDDDKYVRVDLNGEWEMSTESVFEDGYMSYNSFSNKGNGNSTATMRLYIKGYDTYSFKYMSDAEGSWDYMILMPADTYWDGSDGLYNTKSKQTQILEATYTFDDPSIEHFIEIVYKKDSSVDKNRDCGFIGIMQTILAEEWRISETEYVKVDDSYYTKEYKYITFDNKNWVATTTYREGYQLNTDTIKTDEYICSNENKYEKLQIVFTDHPYISTINEYTIGDLIEENARECQWVTLTFDTDKTIPMQRFRIDATDPQTSGYYFIRFSSTPNGSFTNTKFSICPDEGIIFDNGTMKNITDQINIEGNIYEYTFSVPIYFADAEQNAPVSQVKYQPI